MDGTDTREKDPRIEAMRQRLVEMGCVMYRQWGGGLAMSIPTKPPLFVVGDYENFETRALARADLIERATRELDKLDAAISQRAHGGRE